MAQTKQQKVEVVEKLKTALSEAASTVLVHFKGVNIGEETEMRRALKSAGVTYTVAKKTLIKRAFEALGHKVGDVPMEGEVALAYGGESDSTAPARLVHEFGVKFKDKLVILGGLFEGAFVGQGPMQEIATIPPVNTLRGMFANVLQSPAQRFAIALSEVAKTKQV